MKRWLVRLCLVVILLAVSLGVYSYIEVSGAQAAETVIPTYGAPAYVDGSPIGGGAGYLNIIDPSRAQYVVSTAAALKSALASATSGQIVYVADGVTITLDSTANMYRSSIGFYVKPGVTLAGGRGRAGVTGGIIKLASGFYSTSRYSLVQCGTGGDVCGLTIVGPQDGTTGGNLWSAIKAGVNSEVYNNEIHGFGYAGVNVNTSITGVWIHHNYIHHCRQEGYGYLVVVDGGDIYHTSSATVEGNIFDYAGHVIAASHGRSSYIFRYNYLGANSTRHQIDCHGQWDGYLDKDGDEYIYPAGENIEIYNNTSTNTVQNFVEIRGIPYSTGSISVHNNWTYTTEAQRWKNSTRDCGLGTISQLMSNISGYKYNAPWDGYLDPAVRRHYVRMEVYDNWYGATPPPSTDYVPSATSNQPPATPAAPVGPTSGQPGTSYAYSVKTTDPDGDSITYTLDWGDGTTSRTGSHSSGSTDSTTHAWTQAGTYAVKVRGTDSKGNVSAWSPSLSVVIGSANQPPLTPAAPEGTTSSEGSPSLSVATAADSQTLLTANASEGTVSSEGSPSLSVATAADSQTLLTPAAPEGTLSVAPATTLQEQGISAATDASDNPLPMSLAKGDPLAIPAPRSGLVWWLLIMSVVLSAVVLLVRAIVRTAVPEAPGGEGYENALRMRK